MAKTLDGIIRILPNNVIQREQHTSAPPSLWLPRVDHPADLARLLSATRTTKLERLPLAHGSNLSSRSYTSGRARLVAPSVKKA